MTKIHEDRRGGKKLHRFMGNVDVSESRRKSRPGLLRKKKRPSLEGLNSVNEHF